MALLRVAGRADRAAPPAPVPRRRAGTGRSTATTSTSRTRRGTRSCPAPLYVGRAVARVRSPRVAMTVGLYARAATDQPCAPSSPTTCSCRRRTSTTTAPTSSSCSPPSRSPVRTRAVARRLAGGAARGRQRCRRRRPAWPLWLLRFEAATVYGASGLSKLLDPDWFGGTVTWHRVVRTRDQLEASVLPDVGRSTCSPTARSTPFAAKVDHRHRAVHRPRAVVAAHPLRRGVGRRLLPRRDPAVGARRGVLVPRDRRARDLGGAVDARPHARRRLAVGRAPPLRRRRRARSTGWPASASSRRPRLARSPSSTATAASSTGGAAVALRRSAGCRSRPGSPCPRSLRRRPPRPAAASASGDAWRPQRRAGPWCVAWRRRRSASSPSSRSASLAPPEHCPRRRRPTSCARPADDAVQLVRAQPARRRHVALRVRRRRRRRRARRLQPRAPRRRRSWASTRRRPPASTARWRAPTVALDVGARATSSSTTDGPRSPSTAERRSAPRRCSPPGSPSGGC